MKNYFIRIPKNFVQENKYDNETIFIYGLLQKTLTYRNQIVFTLNWLFKELGLGSNSAKSRKRIRNILKKLHDDKYIIFSCDIEKIDSFDLIFADFDIEAINNKYVSIFDYEFDMIHRYNNKDIYNIFCLFANIKSRIDDKGYCYPGFRILKANTGIKSDTSIGDYLKILQNKLGLIFYDNLGFGIADKKVGQLNNVYVMNYEGSKELLQKAIDYRREQLKEYYDKIEKGKEANKKRSETQKKNWAEKKGIDIVPVDNKPKSNNHFINTENTEGVEDWGITYDKPNGNINKQTDVKHIESNEPDIIVTVKKYKERTNNGKIFDIQSVQGSEEFPWETEEEAVITL